MSCVVCFQFSRTYSSEQGDGATGHSAFNYWEAPRLFSMGVGPIVHLSLHMCSGVWGFQFCKSSSTPVLFVTVIWAVWCGHFGLVHIYLVTLEYFFLFIVSKQYLKKTCIFSCVCIACLLICGHTYLRSTSLHVYGYMCVCMRKPKADTKSHLPFLFYIIDWGSSLNQAQSSWVRLVLLASWFLGVLPLPSEVRITGRLPHPSAFTWLLRVWSFQFSCFPDKHLVTALSPQSQSWTVFVYLLSFAHFMPF